MLSMISINGYSGKRMKNKWMDNCYGLWMSMLHNTRSSCTPGTDLLYSLLSMHARRKKESGKDKTRDTKRLIFGF